MCGILGFINGEKGKFKDPERVFAEMLFFGTRRGFDGTGAAVVAKDKIYTHKSCIWGPDFIYTKTYHNVIAQNLKDARVAIGHNRAATKGTVSDDNAHPFQHKHITLVHNGFIQNHYALLPHGINHDVDSYSAAYAIAEKGEKAGLEALRGAFALVWYNAEDNTVNMARNEARELSVMYVKDDDGKDLNLMLFMSEYNMLYDIMIRNKLNFDGKFKIVPPFTHYKFNADNPREFTRTPFTEPQNQSVSTAGAGVTRIGRNAAGAATGTSQNNPQVRPKSGSYANQEIEAIEAKLSKFSKKERERYGVPATRKKLRQAIQRLASGKYQVGDNIMVYADTYTTYKNQKNRGTIVGSKYSDVEVGIQISNATKEMYKAMRDANGAYVTVVNAKRGPHGRTYLVCAVADGYMKAIAESSHRKDIQRAQRAASEDAKQIQEDSNKTIYVAGPNGSTIPLKQFLALAATGCAGCTGVVNPNFAHEVIWVGDCPICHVCADDEAVLKQYGIEKPKKASVVH